MRDIHHMGQGRKKKQLGGYTEVLIKNKRNTFWLSRETRKEQKYFIKEKETNEV